MDERESRRIETINVPLSSAQREALARPEHAHVGPLLERMFRVKFAAVARPSRKNSLPPCKLCGNTTRDQRGGICGRCAFPDGVPKTATAREELQHDYAALCLASEHTKLAARHTMPNYGGSSFSYANKQEMMAGTLRQRPIRAILGMVPPQIRREGVKELHRQYRGMAAGTVTYNPKQKRSINLVDRDWFKGNSREKRRMVLAHEAFHSRTPVLGHSEIAAHLYGGWKANKGLKRVWSGDGTGAINELGHLATTRPDRLGIELALLAGAGYAGYRGYKALRNKLRGSDEEQRRKEST